MDSIAKVWLERTARKLRSAPDGAQREIARELLCSIRPGNSACS